MTPAWRAAGARAAAALLALSLSVAGGPLAAAASDPAAAVSGPPPLAALDGEPLTADRLRQGTALLVVWASWSPRCRDVARSLERLAATWSDEAFVASVVFQESSETVLAFLGREDLAAPVYLDLSGEFSKRHQVTTLPMLLIFSGGHLAFRGKLSANPDPVIERVLATTEGS